MDAEFAPETLKGDVRDFLLSHLRGMQDPWSKLTEKQQADKIAACENAARQLIGKATAVIAAHEFPKVTVNVGKFTFKEGEVKAEFTCHGTDDNLLAIKGAGRCVLVLADPETFSGQKGEAKPDPDQRGLELGTEYTAGDGDGFEDAEDEPDDENDDITADENIDEHPEGGPAEGNDVTHLLRDSGEMPDLPESLDRRKRQKATA